MDRVLLSGIISLVIGTSLTVILPALGINVSLARFLDGSITLGDLANLIGLILVGWSEGGSQTIKAAFSARET